MLCESLIIEKPAHVAGKLARILRVFDDERVVFVLKQLRNTRSTADNGRDSACHGLQRGHGKGVLARGCDEDIGGRVIIDDLGGVRPDPDPFADSRVGRVPLHLLRVNQPGEGKHGVFREQCHSFDRLVHALLVGIVGHQQKNLMRFDLESLADGIAT